MNSCYYVSTNTTTTVDDDSVRVTSILDRHALDTFHRVTARFYKKYDTAPVISLNLETTSYVRSRLRLPSYPVAMMQCPRYDVRTNIVFDEYNNCDDSRKPHYMFSRHFSTREEENVWDRIVDDDERRLRLDMGHPWYIGSVDRRSERCSIVSINTRGDYKEFERYSLRRGTGACLIYFDPKTVHLNGGDYFVHVSSYNQFVESGGSCHLADSDVGKLFQLANCDDSATAMYMKSAYEKCCHFPMGAGHL